MKEIEDEPRLGVICDTCGSHVPMSAREFAERLIIVDDSVAGCLCDCRETDPGQISVYYICDLDAPCESPECLCKTGVRP